MQLPACVVARYLPLNLSVLDRITQGQLAIRMVVTHLATLLPLVIEIGAVGQLTVFVVAQEQPFVTIRLKIALFGNFTIRIIARVASLRTVVVVGSFELDAAIRKKFGPNAFFAAIDVVALLYFLGFGDVLVRIIFTRKSPFTMAFPIGIAFILRP